MKPVPHGEPYAGKLHVRFDEGYPPKNGEVRFEGSRGPSGRTLRGRPALLYTLLDLKSRYWSRDRICRRLDYVFTMGADLMVRRMGA